LSLAVALRRARDAGLDLVEVNPRADPPVCRLLNYSTYRHDQRRREKDLRKKQVGMRRTNVVKMLRLSARISDNDMQVKARNANQFLDDGYKVRRCSETPGSPRLVVALQANLW